MILLNGTTGKDALRGQYTCHTHSGQSSVVDYCLVSKTLYSQVSDFGISEPLANGDHFPLELVLNIHVTPKPQERTRQARRRVPPLRPNNSVDAHLSAALKMQLSFPQQSLRLLGSASDAQIQQAPIEAFCDGSCFLAGKESQAGLGVFFRTGAHASFAERLPGDIQTSSRAELEAVIRTLETVDTGTPLKI